MTNLPENRELSELAPDDFFLFELPETKSAQASQPTSSPPRPLLSLLWPFIRIATAILVIVLAGAVLYLLAILPLQQKLDSSSERLISLQSELQQLKNDLRQVEARIPPPTPPPTPTPLPPAWSFSGQVHKINSRESFAGLTVSLVIWMNREGAPRETLPTIQLSHDGRFDIPKNLSLETGWAVQATINGLPYPWQLRLSEAEGAWQPGSAPNVFVAVFEQIEDLEPLLLTAAIERIFSGQVVVETNPGVYTGLDNVLITVEMSYDGTNWQQIVLPEDLRSGQDGQFEIRVDSDAESAWFRLRANLPSHYQVSGLTEMSSDQRWIVGPGMIATTTGPITTGELRDLRLQRQLILIELSSDQAALFPDHAGWRLEQQEYPVYIIPVTPENVDRLAATWELLLPAGLYYLEVWTPAQHAGAITRVTVQLAQGYSAGHPGCPPYLSNQANSDGIWWDLLNANGRQEKLIVNVTPGSSLTMINVVIAEGVDERSNSLNKMMAVGPVRFMVADEFLGFQFPDCALVSP
jgi:hypothetical protein